MATATQERPTTKAKESGDDLSQLLNKPASIERADLLQMKMENESIMAECRLHPRDLSAVKAELEDQLDAFPELAVESIYTKPVGGGKDVRGLSIRAAETLAEAYGYNRIRSDVTPLDAITVKVEATFTDYQKGRVWQDGGILSKAYKQAANRGGGTKFHDDDRFYNVVCKAEVSKRIREVVLRSINSGLKAWYEAECERRIGELLTDDVINKTVKSFEGIGVTLQQLEKRIGRSLQMGWTKDDRKALIGVWQAIKDNETTVAEAFGTMETPKPKADSLTTLADHFGKKESQDQPEVDTGPLAKWKAAIDVAGDAQTLQMILDDAVNSDLTADQGAQVTEWAEAKKATFGKKQQKSMV